MGRFKFGDIIENGWAADSNPRRRGIYLWSFNRTGRMNPGKHVKLLHDDGKTGELRISDDDKMTVVGTIFDAKVSEALAAKDAEIATLREALELAARNNEMWKGQVTRQSDDLAWYKTGSFAHAVNEHLSDAGLSVNGDILHDCIRRAALKEKADG